MRYVIFLGDDILHIVDTMDEVDIETAWWWYFGHILDVFTSHGDQLKFDRRTGKFERE